MNTRQGAPPEKMERSLAFSHRGLVGKFAGRSPIFFDRKEFDMRHWMCRSRVWVHENMALRTDADAPQVADLN